MSDSNLLQHLVLFYVLIGGVHSLGLLVFFVRDPDPRKKSFRGLYHLIPSLFLTFFVWPMTLIVAQYIAMVKRRNGPLFVKK